MSIHGFMDQNGQVQKYDYNDLENIPDTIGEEIVLVQDVQPIEENNKIWLPLTQSSNTVEVPTMDEFNALAEEVQSGGLSEAAKEALLTLLQHVAYIDEHGQDYYDDLEEALAGGTQYTITNNLTGCATSNSSTKIVEGRTYTATITASSGYTLDGASVTITIGGATVTGHYNNGSISIPNVTGNLVITVVASSEVTSISAVFTQGDTDYGTNSTLDSLRANLVVTATYSNSSTVVVSEYTLSGTMAVGTNTITVGYGGKTTTFNVSVEYDYVLVESDFERGYGLAANGINYPGYKRTNAQRLSYTRFDVIFTPGKTYTFAATSTYNTAAMGIPMYNEALYNDASANVNANHNSDAQDDGWMPLTTNKAMPTTINSSPFKGVRFSFRQSDSSPNLSNDFKITKLTIKEVTE